MARRSRRRKQKFRVFPRVGTLRHSGILLAALILGIAGALTYTECAGKSGKVAAAGRTVKNTPTKAPATRLAGDDPELDILLTALDGVAMVPFSCNSGWVARDADGREIARTTSGGAASVGIAADGKLLLRGGDAGTRFIQIAALGDEPLQLGKNQYFGKAIFRATDKGVRVVNRVSLEQYLASVVGSEMYASSSPPAALEAQAIAARTYARYAVEELGRSPLPDSQEAQAYYGISRETAATRRAVMATRSQILTFDGETLPAFYHSTCGGSTVDGTVLTGSKAPDPLRGVPCGYCENAKFYRWSAHVSQKSLGSICTSLGIGRQCLKIEPRGDSADSWANLQIIGNAGLSNITARQLRTLILKFGGNVQMPSPFLQEIAGDRDGITVRGRGFGHGVGLCQMGAAEMGRRGFDTIQILNHYYPGARLTPSAAAAPEVAARGK